MSGPAPEWFRTPGRAFRTAAFWFWHRIPTDAEIHTQVADMQAKGIGAAMIQARPALGLETYLSPDYLKAYRTAAREIRRLGLGLTIYDEYGWMSGHGGGRTVRGAEHLRERHLFWTSAPAGRTGRTELKVSNVHSPFLDWLGEIGRAWLYDGGAPRWSDWRTELVVVHPEVVTDAAGTLVIRSPSNPSEAGPAACRLVIDHQTLPPDTMVTAFVSARCVTSRLINYLLPEAAERFAEVVYAPLLAAAGDAAEDIFFDHPHAGFYVWDEHAGPVGNSLLRDDTPCLDANAAALLSLTRDVGPDTPGLRAGYLDTYAHRMHEAFFGTLSRWAQERGLGFTGHELLTHVGGWALHGGLTGFDPRTMPGVDHFGIDGYRSATTTDAADFLPQLSAKLGDSVARAHGRSRCSVEQYATGRPVGRPTLAGQWDLTAATFRAQAIRHILFGARRIVLHAVNVTDGFDDDRLLANPRFDFPPAYNFQPWWKDCPGIFDELARLSAFLEDGEPLRDVALFYPLETIVAEGPEHACGVHFGWWAEALARAGIGYDVVDERMLSAVTGPGSRYRTLILPSVEALKWAASVGHIADFVRRGGALRVSGVKPATARDGAVGDISARLGDLGSGAGRVIHLSGASADDIAVLVGGLDRAFPGVRFLDDGPTWCAVARCGLFWRIAVFNDQDHPRSLEIRAVQDAAELRFWEAATGTLSEPVEVAIGTAPLTIGAHRVACMTLAPVGQPRPTPPVLPRSRLDVELVAVLDEGWTLEIGESAPVPVVVDRGWERQGWPTFAGTGIYRLRLSSPVLTDGRVRQLRLPGFRNTADLWINGAQVGRHVAGEACFDLPSGSRDLDLELHVRNTAANRYYAGRTFDAGRRDPSGIVNPPLLVAVRPDPDHD